MWLLMCPKASKGASSGHWVVSLFVIEICLLVVGYIYTPRCVVCCGVAWCEMLCPWVCMYVQPLQGWWGGGGSMVLMFLF